MDLSSKIKRKASEIGFSKIGIAKAEFHLEDEFNINRWIENGYHGSMSWIEKRKEERSNIKKYYPDSKSIMEQKNLGENEIKTIHVLLAILLDPNNSVTISFKHININYEIIKILFDVN